MRSVWASCCCYRLRTMDVRLGLVLRNCESSCCSPSLSLSSRYYLFACVEGREERVAIKCMYVSSYLCTCEQRTRAGHRRQRAERRKQRDMRARILMIGGERLGTRDAGLATWRVRDWVDKEVSWRSVIFGVSRKGGDFCRNEGLIWWVEVDIRWTVRFCCHTDEKLCNWLKNKEKVDCHVTCPWFLEYIVVNKNGRVAENLK